MVNLLDHQIIEMFDFYNKDKKLNEDKCIITSKFNKSGNINLYQNTINLYYKFDSSYVALNYKLFNDKNNLIFEVYTISNNLMTIRNYLNNEINHVKNSAMNDIVNVGLYYCETNNILYVCITYVCLGYQNYLCKIDMNIKNP